MSLLEFLAVLLLADLSTTFAVAGVSSSRYAVVGSPSYWEHSYSFAGTTVPNMHRTREQFAGDMVARMWENRPSRAHAAICFQGSWRVQRPKQVSPSMTVAYTRGSFTGSAIYMYDCMYIWGPGQSWWSWDDADERKMAYEFDDTKCTFNSTVWDIDCL